MAHEKRATYRASTLTTVAAAAGTAPFFIMEGSATKIIKIKSITVTGANLTLVQYLSLVVRKFSTAASGGTATALVQTPMDANEAAGTANLCSTYTVAPTPGTTVGTLSTATLLGQATTAVAGGAPLTFTFDFGKAAATQEPTLRGIAQGIGLAFSVAPATAVTLSLTVEWTEE